MLKYRTKSTPQTVEEYNRDIDLAEEDIKQVMCIRKIKLKVYESNGKANCNLDSKSCKAIRRCLQADNVFDKIKSSAYDVRDNPEKYPPDKYKINNKGNYRAYEIYRYRISYLITKKDIYIVRLRGTDQNPREY